MLCDECGRNEAVIHIVQAGPNGRTEHNLCEECARHYSNFLVPTEQGNVSINDFLKGVFRTDGNPSPSEELPEREEDQAESDVLACPNCGMRYEDFRETGKIGCSVCYETFRRELFPILRRIHGASVHRGKVPRRSGSAIERRQHIARLRSELQQAIDQEEYERAAELRDEIRALTAAEQEGGNGNGAQ